LQDLQELFNKQLRVRGDWIARPPRVVQLAQDFFVLLNRLR